MATRARILVLGAGAAGLATAARLAQRLDGAAITLLDQRQQHLYQPGFTLVAAGLREPGYTISRTADYVPRTAQWIEERAAEIDPVAKSVLTDAGRRLPYDFLVLATGLSLDYAAIEGMDVARIGRDGLGSVYAGPEQAAATWRAMSAFADRGGIGLFGRPETEMKCAGAPLKYAFLTDDVLRRRGRRGRAELIYNAQNTGLFSVPIVSEKLRMLFGQRGIGVNYSHVLRAIDLGRARRQLRHAGRAQGAALRLHQRDPADARAGCGAPLAARLAGRPLRRRWLAEVDRHTLRHARFPEIFAVGDVAGVRRARPRPR